MPHVISAFVFPKSLARSLMVKETVKKSKASHDHARKATCHEMSDVKIWGKSSTELAYQEKQPLHATETG